jgi:hypothetical protein
VKSITIHDLDDSLEAMIEQKAREEGLSLNKTVKMLLRQALGLAPGGNGDKKADFTEFCGVWTKADEAEFARNTKDLRQVDPRDWQ